MSETLHFKEKMAHQRRLQPDIEVPTQEGSCLEDRTRQRRSLLLLLGALGEKVGRARGSPMAS